MKQTAIALALVATMGTTYAQTDSRQKDRNEQGSTNKDMRKADRQANRDDKDARKTNRQEKRDMKRADRGANVRGTNSGAGMGTTSPTNP